VRDCGLAIQQVAEEAQFAGELALGACFEVASFVDTVGEPWEVSIQLT
jgi:hypothetical protein